MNFSLRFYLDHRSVLSRPIFHIFSSHDFLRCVLINAIHKVIILRKCYNIKLAQFFKLFWAQSIQPNVSGKFLGVKWVATGPKGLVLFHSQNGFPAHLPHCKMKDVGSPLLVLKLDDDFQDFDGNINDIV